MLEQSWDPSFKSLLAEALVLLVPDLIISLSGTVACDDNPDLICSLYQQNNLWNISWIYGTR